MPVDFLCLTRVSWEIGANSRSASPVPSFSILHIIWYLADFVFFLVAVNTRLLWRRNGWFISQQYFSYRQLHCTSTQSSVIRLLVELFQRWHDCWAGRFSHQNRLTVCLIYWVAQNKFYKYFSCRSQRTITSDFFLSVKLNNKRWDPKREEIVKNIERSS